jgi:hypothetical protein
VRKIALLLVPLELSNCATRQIRRTNKIQAVSSYLGHGSPSITLALYTHEQLEDDELFDPEDGE